MGKKNIEINGGLCLQMFPNRPLFVLTNLHDTLATAPSGVASGEFGTSESSDPNVPVSKHEGKMFQNACFYHY